MKTNTEKIFSWGIFGFLVAEFIIHCMAAEKIVEVIKGK